MTLQEPHTANGQRQLLNKSRHVLTDETWRQYMVYVWFSRHLRVFP